MSSIPLLARQPIFNHKIKVVGYELLCRNKDLVFDNKRDADAASSQVLLNSFTELNIEEVVGSGLAFVNFTRTLIDNHPPFDRQRLVIEVLEGQQIDTAMLYSLKNLREQGYTIALDDFVLNEQTERLIPYADIIKLDVLALSRKELQAHIEYIKPLGIQLLAEKIETYEMFEACKDMGFDLFQGYFLAKPQILTGKKIAENKQSALMLLSALQNPDVPLDKIERMIASDTILSFKLLRLVNSAAFGLNREIESLRQAIILLGLNKLRNWVNLLVLSNLGGKPHELSVAALARARMCEQLANHLPAHKRTDSFFTAGLFSILDAFLDTPMAKLLETLSLSKPITSAILNFDGDEGKILHTVQAYEKGAWSEIDWRFLDSQEISPELLSTIYVEAIKWVTDTMAGLGVEG